MKWKLTAEKFVIVLYYSLFRVLLLLLNILQVLPLHLEQETPLLSDFSVYAWTNSCVVVHKLSWFIEDVWKLGGEVLVLLVQHMRVHPSHSLFALPVTEERGRRVNHTLLRLGWRMMNALMWLIPSLQFVLFLAHVGSVLSVWYFLVDAVIIVLGLAASGTKSARVSAASLRGSTASFPLAFKHERCASMSTISSFLLWLDLVEFVKR